MKINLFLRPDFESAYLINGAFTDKRGVTIQSDRVTYITLLPLCAALLPYTVKICGVRPDSNAGLVKVTKLSDCEAVIRFAPRYNYVYCPDPPAPKEKETDCAVRFFGCVTSGDYSAARALMTPELSATVTDEALGEFFSEYEEVIPNDDFSDGGGYYLVRKSGGAAMFDFTRKNGLIDDITERENTER